MSIEAEEHLLITNELERKYTAALANIYAEYERGRFNGMVAYRCFIAVYESVAGLVEGADLDEFGREFEKLKEA